MGFGQSVSHFTSHIYEACRVSRGRAAAPLSNIYDAPTAKSAHVTFDITGVAHLSDTCGLQVSPGRAADPLSNIRNAPTATCTHMKRHWRHAFATYARFATFDVTHLFVITVSALSNPSAQVLQGSSPSRQRQGVKEMDRCNEQKYNCVT